MKAIYLVSVIILLVCGCASPKNDKASRKSPYVSDLADILTQGQEDSLSHEMKTIERITGAQIAVLTVDSLAGESIESFSLRTANEWQIGRAGHNDGILMTVAMKERSMRIEVGTGLEDVIRDEVAAAIIRDLMVPGFRDGKYFDGLLAAVRNMGIQITVNRRGIPQPTNE